jgi:nucleoside 2-deoxyribosyltransferase
MKKIYFAGKFNKIKEPEISLEKSLVNDFRSQLLGSSKLLTHYQDNLIVNNKFQYVGPFYCEQASNGNFTSTDCNEVLNAEYNSVLQGDVLVVVFGENFSVGSVVELGWALNSNKKIILLYQEEASNYTIKSEYWFAIANAIKRSKDLIIRKYKTYSELTPMIQQTLEEVI